MGQTVSEPGGRRAPVVTLIVGGALVAAALVYIAAHWLLLSDGATVDFAQAPSASGLPVDVWRPGLGGLQTGDRVLALDGRPVDDWLAPWMGGLPQPEAAQVRYRVERAGVVLDVLVPLQPYDFWAALGANWTSLLALGYLFGVGVVLFVLRPYAAGARALFLISSGLFSSSLVYFLGLQASDLRYVWLVGLWIWSTVVLFGIAMAGFLHFILVFPRTRPSLVRHPALLFLIYLGAWLPYLAVLAATWPQAATASARLVLIVRRTDAISAVCFTLAVVSSWLAYRQSETESERRQLRWIVWAIYVSEVPWIVLVAGPGAMGLTPIVPPFLLGILWFTIPTAFAIAILRERLFDIDVIIHRTLVYSLLTAALAVVYFGCVVVLQAGYVSLTGQSRSTLVTVLSTLAIATLFGPARRWAQSFIDRRFFRRKYDAARALAGFSMTLRDNIDLDQLCTRLVDVVDDTMQPVEVSLWIKSSHL